MNANVKQMPPITERQRKCLELKARGKKTRDIATEIGISVSRLGAELFAAYAILGVSNGVHAVARGVAEGWLDISQEHPATKGNGEPTSQNAS